MTIGTLSDVLTRIGGIQQQLQSLRSGALLDSALGAGGVSGSAAPTPGSAGAFAGQLAAAQQPPSLAGAAVAGAPGAQPAGGVPSTLGGVAGLLAGAPSGGVGLSAGTSAGVGLSPAASAPLTSAQQQFASTLSAETGLNPNVVSAWVLAEESGGAAQSRQAAGNNDWLNIGYTDSGTYGAGDSVWSDPTTAATATAAWLKGQDSIPGYGTASAGIQSILATVGQPPAAQIQAIQSSGWASGGYPSLPSLYAQTAGS